MVTDATTESPLGLARDDKGDFFYPDTHVHDAGVGLTEKTIDYIVNIKEEPEWVREFRMNGSRLS
jgi:Fe-S cluster assembly protein SufB